MADNALIPVSSGGGSPMAQLRQFIAQPAVARALPWFIGMVALGGAGLTWQMVAPSPQRVLYAQIDDAERAGIVAALDKGGVHYRIDNSTGAMTVDEGDVYKARMLVAQSGALAMPDASSDALDKLPMGASRALEDERLHAAREHELMLTIKQIDGVQAVRVHIAEGEKSVFVRDTTAPTASVMLRLADGRQLSDSQVNAIVNLVAGSVEGMTPDAVKVVDQHGRLLSQKSSADDTRIELQTRLEDRLHDQIAQLLTPMLGEGNFTSDVAVDLDMDQVTSARESYDKAGVLKSETQAQSQTSAPATTGGIPGVLSNTPPPATVAKPGAPQGTPTAAAAPGAVPTTGESSATRQYELGREVAVSNTTPGTIKRLSVAVALSAKAMAHTKAADIDQIKALVSAAVGANPARGDQIAVIARNFDVGVVEKTPFYEAPWFAGVLHNAAAVIAVLLVLLLGVRPLIKALRRPAAPDVGDIEVMDGAGFASPALLPAVSTTQRIDAEMLGRQIGFAQQLIAQKPGNAVIALRQMLQPPVESATP